MFITFEGPEGGGKSTAIRSVAHRLQLLGYDVLSTREPGAGLLGKQIRDLLLHGEKISAETELLLFLADRSNHVVTIINPALASGTIVLCDRFIDSTWVYQGFARGLDLAFLSAGNSFATRDLKPDLTLLFDLSPEIGLGRIQNQDRLDAEPIAFHQLVREGFLTLAQQDPKRWQTLDASQSALTVEEIAFQSVLTKLSELGVLPKES